MQFPYLSFIESLQPSDLGWIDANAEILNLRPHDLLISEGSSNSDLYILETGLLSVYTGDSDDEGDALHHEIARIGAGSLVGDLSWLETQVTSASVSALENSLILRVDGAALEEKIAADSEFAARFLHGNRAPDRPTPARNHQYSDPLCRQRQPHRRRERTGQSAAG